MPNANYQEFIEKGNELFQRRYKRQIHLFQPKSFVDTESSEQLINDLLQLHNEIPEIVKFDSKEAVFLKELKALSKGTAFDLQDDIRKDIATPDEILEMYNIKKDDIDELKDWLLANKNNIKLANNRLFEFHSTEDRDSVALGVEPLRITALELVQNKIDMMEILLKKYFNNFTGIQEFFNNYKVYADCIRNRSATYKVSKIVTISVEHMVYMKDNVMKLDFQEFLRVYCHEVLGHGLNFAQTATTDLPFFIKDSLWLPFSITTRESVAQYFQDWFFYEVMDNSEVFKFLNAIEPFENIYTRYIDTEILGKYWTKLSRVAIWILAKSKMNDHLKQIEEISKYAISPKYATKFVNRYRNHWNRATELLLPEDVMELKYAVDPVAKVIGLGDKKKIEKLILTGMWTPDGLVDWVKFNLKHSK